MSQKNQSDGGGQKGFTVGRGLLAAAKTLNCSMNEQRSGRQIGGLGSGVRVGGGGMEGQESGAQGSRLGGSSQLGSTMKLFASLGLSPSDLDALAQIPEEDISVETLPEILMQLKSRKGESGERHMSAGTRDLSSMSSDASFRGGRDSWDNMSMGRSSGPSAGQGSALTQQPMDFGFSSMQDISPSRGFNSNYNNNSGGAGNRDRPYSELSRNSYGGLDMGLPPSDPMYMQRRMGSPSQGKIQDFLGVLPPMFPHVCSLCDFDVHSNMEWNQHVSGLRHAETSRQLINMYPDWDPGMVSNRGMGLMGTPNLSLGLLGPGPGPGPMSSGQTGRGMTCNWGLGSSGLSGKSQLGPPKPRGRVVVVKYERKPLNEKVLFDFAEPFGRVREHLVLKNKAFLEMSTHDQAMDMVNYYQQHPASMFGKPVFFNLSKELMVIEKNDRSGDRSWDAKGLGSKVVFFANLPKETEKKQELLTIAERFGTVEKHLFLNDQAFVQLGTAEDAEMLVKYHSVNPLTIRGRLIRLNICTKYKTLNLNRRSGGGAGGDSRSWKSSAVTSSSTSSAMKSSSTKSSSSKSSTHSSRTKEEDKKKKKEEDKKKDEEDKKKKDEEEAVKDKAEEKAAVEEPISSVPVRGEGEEPADNDTEEVEPANECLAEETVQESDVIKKEVPDDVTEAQGDVGGAEDDAEQRAEPQDQTAPMEMEAAGPEEREDKEDVHSEPGESSDNVEGDLPADADEDVLENMEDFVTLDEVAEDEDESHREFSVIDNTKAGGMRVVNVLGFRRGYNFLKELLGLAEPFGKVVKYLVLDLRPEAYLQFTTEEEARAMAKFYNSNVTASVCGRSVKVNHSMTYPTIQCGSSRVVYVGQLPNVGYSDEEVLKLAETFGTIKRYFLNRLKRECFIEMENPEDAEKMSEYYKSDPAQFYGRRLKIYVSRKYRQLKYGHRRVTAPEEKKASKRESSKSSKHAEEPPAKKVKEEPKTEEQQEKEEQEKEEELESAEVVIEESEEHVTENSDACNQSPPNGGQEEAEKQNEVEAAVSQNRGEEQPLSDATPSPTSLPLPPFDPDSPVGVEHIKSGYYCRVCFLFYSNEDVAKRLHCSTQSHYEKLQKYLEKRQSAEECTKLPE
ncbi:matrin 3-like 1.2 isoform X2 [Thalassophryne amazonica]|uniref:matrin 3-like 1.2 isoform X2 n=1 Tax=Thalassophryne amazonica TaxID=390379 RepID=UPI0014725928|nr:matrin 3-like 1.2 isoform X2 [Thalassophryne amazonica]